LVFHCDPFAFLDRPEREIEALYRYTDLRMKRMRAESDG